MVVSKDYVTFNFTSGKYVRSQTALENVAFNSIGIGGEEGLILSNVSGVLYVGGIKLSGLLTPSEDDHAATKKYVDDNSGSSSPSINVETLSADKTLLSTSPTYQYLDAGSSNRNINLPSTGVLQGQQFIIINTSKSMFLNVKSSDGTELTSIKTVRKLIDCTISCTALQATPTSRNHWHITLKTNKPDIIKRHPKVWTSSETPSGYKRRVCWSPYLHRFCAVGSSTVITSDDGIAWTARNFATNFNCYDVIWADKLKMFIAMGDSATKASNYSYDGITWYESATAVTGQSLSWAHEIGMVCVVGSNTCYTSTDGINWTSQTVPAYEYMTSCWSPDLGIFCAVANYTAQKAITSPDGVAWTERDTAVQTNWRGLCWSPELGIFNCVTYSSDFMQSYDGITWFTRTTPYNNNWRHCCWSSEIGCFVATSDGTICAISVNGVTWYSVDMPKEDEWGGICWVPEIGAFCAVNWYGSTTQCVALG